MDRKIHHDIEEQKFYIILEQGEATLKYRMLDDRTLDFYSTFVPGKDRGQGIGALLVEHALKWARGMDFRVQSSCPFVADYMQKNPEFED